MICHECNQPTEWRININSSLIQNDPHEGTAAIYYRPITCLRIMRKLLTAQIMEKINYTLISQILFPEEQKGLFKRNHRHRRSTVNWSTLYIDRLLYINQHILKEGKTKRKTYKNAYDLFPWKQRNKMSQNV